MLEVGDVNNLQGKGYLFINLGDHMQPLPLRKQGQSSDFLVFGVRKRNEGQMG